MIQVLFWSIIDPKKSKLVRYLKKRGVLRKVHIPWSIHFDCVSVLEYDKGKEFKSVLDLLYDFERKGITKR